MNLLQELNDSQREAVLYLDSPSLVIAGAGSGKTRVLTYKISYLLQQGMKPWNILALTFTNKAAREMRSRISTMVGEELASQLWMGTFHSIFSRILRQESEKLGFGRDFTIYDAADSKSLIRNIMRDMKLDEKVYKPATVASRISMLKNRLILPDEYVKDPSNYERDQHSGMPALGQIYVQYFQKCRASNVMDFDDLLLYTWLLFIEQPDVARRWEEKFHFVLVDEYQDTNYAQHLIVWLLTQNRQRLCVVGDDAQSIYSFRGANIDNILRFRQRYKDTRIFKLEQNYRSTQTIVSAANSLIRHNHEQIPKEVFSRNEVGAPIDVLPCYSDIDEANAVVRCVREFRRHQRIPYQEMAILYRTNAQSRTFEEALRKSSVPYRVYGGTSFYQRKEIKDVISYLRLVVNLHDEEALRRVINYPTRGIGTTTMDKVYNTASQLGLSPWDVISSTSHLSGVVTSAAFGRLQAFSQMIRMFHELCSQVDAYTLVKDIVERVGICADINKGRSIEDISRQENLQELLGGIASFVQERQEAGKEVLLTNYLQEVSLLSDVDEDDSADEERLTLMTVHSAKGLEFRVVFVVGMEEMLFPSQMSVGSPRGLEEERRLFYVAITRAQEYLVLTHAKSRFRYGMAESCHPSRFLQEIDRRYLAVRGANSIPRPEHPVLPKTTPQTTSHITTYKTSPITSYKTPSITSTVSGSGMSSSVSTPTEIRVGTRVLHDRFGEGTVSNITGTGMDTKATVDFTNVGIKQLLLRFAKLKVLSSS